MVQLIIGKKGSGKTKRILDMVNSDVEQSKGDVIFIDDDKRYMYDVKHEVRFIDVSEYKIDSKDKFYGFINGILASNFDISAIYIDGFMKIINDGAENIEGYFGELKAIFDKHEVKAVLNISTDNPPAYMKEYEI